MLGISSWFSLIPSRALVCLDHQVLVVESALLPDVTFSPNTGVYVSADQFCKYVHYLMRSLTEQNHSVLLAIIKNTCSTHKNTISSQKNKILLA